MRSTTNMKIKEVFLIVVIGAVIGLLVSHVAEQGFQSQKDMLSILGITVAVILFILLSEFHGFLFVIAIQPFTVHFYNGYINLSPLIFGIWLVVNTVLRRLSFRRMINFHSTLNKVLLIYWLINILSFLWGSYNPVNTFVPKFGYFLSSTWDIAGLTFGIVAFLRVSMINNERHVSAVINVLMIGAIVNAIMLLINTVHPDLSWPSYFNPNPTYQDGGVRYDGTLEDFELFSEYCGLVLTLLMYRVLSGQKRLFNTILVVMVLFAMVSTGSRGMIFALLISVAIVSIIFRQYLLVIGGILTTFLLSHIPLIRNSLLFKRILRTGFVGITPSDRVGVWSNVLKQVQHRPIWGFGPVFTEHINGYTYAHNLYLSILYQTGSVGLLAFGTFLIMMIWKMLKTVVGSKRSMQDYVPLLGLLAVVADQMIIEFNRNMQYTILLLCYFGVLILITNRTNKRCNELEDRNDWFTRNSA